MYSQAVKTGENLLRFKSWDRSIRDPPAVPTPTMTACDVAASRPSGFVVCQP